MHSPFGARALAGTQVYPEQACAIVFSPEVAITIFFSLNFSKSSRTTYVQIFAVDRKH